MGKDPLGQTVKALKLSADLFIYLEVMGNKFWLSNN